MGARRGKGSCRKERLILSLSFGSNHMMHLAPAACTRSKENNLGTNRRERHRRLQQKRCGHHHGNPRNDHTTTTQPTRTTSKPHTYTALAWCCILQHTNPHTSYNIQTHTTHSSKLLTSYLRSFSLRTNSSSSCGRGEGGGGGAFMLRPSKLKRKETGPPAPTATNNPFGPHASNAPPHAQHTPLYRGDVHVDASQQRRQHLKRMLCHHRIAAPAQQPARRVCQEMLLVVTLFDCRKRVCLHPQPLK